MNWERLLKAAAASFLLVVVGTMTLWGVALYVQYFMFNSGYHFTFTIVGVLFIVCTIGMYRDKKLEL
jgi:hypothetical protein